MILYLFCKYINCNRQKNNSIILTIIRKTFTNIDENKMFGFNSNDLGFVEMSWLRCGVRYMRVCMHNIYIYREEFGSVQLDLVLKGVGLHSMRPDMESNPIKFSII